MNKTRRESKKQAQGSALPVEAARGCPMESPSSVHQADTQARAALWTSSVTMAGRQQLGCMKNGGCDIWVFAETDVFS